MRYLVRNASIVNEGKVSLGDVLIDNELILETGLNLDGSGAQEIDARGKYLLPGAIDDQVHFREPGLTHKADIHSESRAAVAGGITSFMEQPNTVPPATTIELLEQKYKRASEVSVANYSFFMGTTNGNLDELLKINPRNVCGVKIFLGSSTGDMLVDHEESLDRIFREVKTLIAVHAEDDVMIRNNLAAFKAKYGEDVPVEAHPLIRSREACYASSAKAIARAKKFGTRLHIFHVSTADELELFDNTIPLREKKITAEACVHHLWFTDADYKTKGNFIKWNPAVKTERDREALWQGLLDNRIDIVATDHAPHTIGEKSKKYIDAPSGGPLVQHALVAMLEKSREGKITIERVVEKMAHAPADLFRIEKRGYIRPGYYADLVLVDLNAPWTVSKENILSKCGWSPFEGTTFHARVVKTFVNGNVVYDDGKIIGHSTGRRLEFLAQ